jgi:TRAP-type C4-dicarboxylate transport system substrate-binding protein
VIVVGDVYDQLSQEQQETLDSAVRTAVDQVPGCVEEAEQKILDEYRSGDQIEVVDDVDTDAFRDSRGKSPPG